MVDTQNNNNIMLNQILESIESLKNELDSKEEKRNKDIIEFKINFIEFKTEVNEKINNLEEQINNKFGLKWLLKSQDIIWKNKRDNNIESLNNLEVSSPLIQNNSGNNCI